MTTEIKVTLTAELADAIRSFKAGMDSIASDAKKASGQMQSGFGGAQKSMTLCVAAGNLLAEGLRRIGSTSWEWLKSVPQETVTWTVEAQKLARTLGITTDQASVLNLAIGDIYGTSEEYLGAVSKLTRTLNTNEGAFHKLGVATRDSKGNFRSTADIMTDVNTALANMKSGTDRNIATTQIYGRGWVEVQRYLNLTKEVMDQAREKAERLNLVVGSDAVTAVAAYRASLNDLDDTVKGLKIRMGSELLPVMTTLNNDMAENGPSAVSSLATAFSFLYQLLNDVRWAVSKLWEEATHGLKNMSLSLEFGLKQGSALLHGHWSEALAVEKEYDQAIEKEAQEHAFTMKSIDKDNESLLYGLMGIKQPGVYQRKATTASGGTGTSGGGTGGTGSGKTSDTSKEWEQAANAAAKYAQKIAEERAQWFNQESERELDESRKLAGLEYAAETEAQKAALEQQRQNLAWAVEDGQITRLAELQALKGIRQDELDIDLAALNQEIEANKLNAVKVAELQNQITAAKRKAAADQLGIDRSMIQEQDRLWRQNTVRGGLTTYVQEAKAAMQQWGTAAKSVAQQVQSAFANCFKGILTGNVGFKSAMLQLVGAIGDAFLGMLANMAAQWLTMKLVEMIIGKQAATSDAAAAASAYAVNAMASVAAIPVWGWAAAPGVGAAAYAEGLAYAAIASAAGGWDRVPSDQVAQIHKDEMVLPAKLAQGARETFANGGSGGGNHYHFHGVTDASWWRHNQTNIAKTLQEMNRNGRTS